ncbi:hypothetical protein Y1Q_0017398 [Alligator mississippiensis]|uniref:Uncharacterized protein n=1 Tax=Alligator mississippiensis TaxID=8496 RepID=A0A151NU59_ALLMI|nr:hypothetical protein Y1Q_0017398 [Alligator mississippiensis]
MGSQDPSARTKIQRFPVGAYWYNVILGSPHSTISYHGLFGVTPVQKSPLHRCISTPSSDLLRTSREVKTSKDEGEFCSLPAARDLTAVGCVVQCYWHLVLLSIET